MCIFHTAYVLHISHKTQITEYITYFLYIFLFPSVFFAIIYESRIMIHNASMELSYDSPVQHNLNSTSIKSETIQADDYSL